VPKQRGLIVQAAEVTLRPMSSEPFGDYPDLREDQMLAIGAYGESVAAYRYTVLSERVPGTEDRKTFAAIAQEELGHQERLEKLARKYYPDRSFYLTDEDKALVLTGPRLIEVRDLEDYRDVVKIALGTELRVSQFYRVMSGRATTTEVVATFRELSSEGFEHHRKLEALARDRGFIP
jgi:rubrerythrin